MSRVKRVYVKDSERLSLPEYPNFHKSGSVKGMREQFYGNDALLVLCGSYIYNVPRSVYNFAH